MDVDVKILPRHPNFDVDVTNVKIPLNNGRNETVVFCC